MVRVKVSELLAIAIEVENRDIRIRRKSINNEGPVKWG